MATSACSLQIIRSLLSSALENGGNVDFEIRLHDEHSSHASTPTRWRQLSALANSRANSFFPMPASPVNKSDPGTRPLLSNCRKACFTSSFPMRVANMGPRLLVRAPPETASRSASLLHEFPGQSRVRQ